MEHFARHEPRVIWVMLGETGKPNAAMRACCKDTASFNFTMKLVNVRLSAEDAQGRTAP